MSTKSPIQSARSEQTGSAHGSRVSVLLAAGAVALVSAAGAAAGLRPRGALHAWGRLDLFSGGALALNGLAAAQHVRLWRRLPASGRATLEVFGATYDPWMGPWMGVLLLAEIAAYFDYGRWHLAPWLGCRPLQLAGILLFSLSLALVVWVDRYLAACFAVPAEQGRALITTGPFRFVRHPRYAALLLTRAAFALMLASGVAWAIVLGWWLVVARRIRLEEEHLMREFGDEYARYAARTPRLAPAVLF